MINYIYLEIAQMSFTSSLILAQSSNGDAAAFSPINLLISLFGYVFGSFCLQKIFQRLNQPNDWMAWVPIANAYATFKAGDQSPWWTVALFIPLVNLVALIFFIIAFANIVKKLNKTPWLLLLMLVPLVNFWLMYHLAFQ